MVQRSLYLLFALAAGVMAAFVFQSGPTVQAGIVCVVPGAGTPLSDALAAAQSGDTIRVAGGDYTENLFIEKSVTLEGGWDVTCTSRDLVANVTTIRPADNTQSVVTIQGNPSDAAAVAPVVDGVTITGGRAELGGNHGGGLKIVDSNAIIQNNIISDNTAALLGGGVWVQRGAPHFEDNRIENNLSTGNGASAYGGGLQLEDSQATLVGNTIANNQVTGDYAYGGGADVSGGGPVLFEGNTISGNSVTIVDQNIARGGGIALRDVGATLTGNLIQNNAISGFIGYGGGLLADTSQITMTGNIVEGNIASADGYGNGGGLAFVNSSDANLSADIIRNNTGAGGNGSGAGGGIYIRTSSFDFEGGRIEANIGGVNGSGNGGGLYASTSGVRLYGVWLLNNAGTSALAGGAGGALFEQAQFTLASSIVSGNQSATVGGISAIGASIGQILNSTFSGNEPIAVEASGAVNAETTLKVLNSIFVDHDVAISQVGPDVVMDVTYSDFYDNAADAQGFTLDPATNLFVDPQLSADYHLAMSSPMIDAGLGLTVYPYDIDGQARAMAGPGGLYQVDIGADEYPGPTQVYRALAEDPADFTLIGPGGPLEDVNAAGQNDWIGNAVLGDDINGDGRDDLVVGARTHTDIAGTVDDSGRVYALYNNGMRRTGPYDLYDQPADLEVRAYLHQQHTGFSLAAAHLDGSDSPDLIIGSVGGTNGNQPVTGTVYAFAGGAGLSGIRTLSPTMQADWRFVADQSTQSFSELGALAAGQLDSSGPDDLVVGEPLATGPGNRLSAGAVYLFFGGNLPTVWDLVNMPADLTIYGPEPDAELGPVAVGDVDGDGQADLIARSGSAAYLFYGPLGTGVVDLATTPADATISGLDFGPLAVGDVDGDGGDDLLLGDDQDVVLVRGGKLPASQTIATAEWARFTGLGSLSSFVRLHSLDWNGDGRDDIVVGDPQVNMAYVIFGDESFVATAPLAASADWLIEGAQDDEQFGFALGSGDLDDDGGADLIIGSRTFDATNHPAFFQDAGAVYVLYGTPALTVEGQVLYLPVMSQP